MSESCDEVRQLAAEAALDLLDGPERSEIFVHVAGCAPCRTELAELAAAADTLLVMAPPAEPPAGFEARVLARLRLADDNGAGARLPRHQAALGWARRWARPAVAMAAALLLGLAGGSLLGGGDRHDSVVAARLLSPDGRSVGQVLVSSEPDRMVCVLDNAPLGAQYSVAITAEDAVTDVGTFRAEGPGWPWAVALPVEGSTVRRVVIRGGSGRLLASATLPA